MNKKWPNSLDKDKSIDKRTYLTGLTLLEILISTLIFALVMAGLVNLFIAAKRLTLHVRSRIQATELGKLFLDPLQMAVRQDTWNQAGNSLNPGVTYCDSPTHPAAQQNPSCPPPADRMLDNIEYSAQYTISDIQPDPIGHPQSILRKVVTTVTWNEPTS